MTTDESPSGAPLAPGVVSIPSRFAVGPTVERLKNVVAAKGLTLFDVVDHSGGARAVGLTMNDTRLLVFGSPRAGTPAMVARPLLAFELPLKALVWADDDGRVWVTYRDASDLEARYQVPSELMAPLSGVGSLIEAALSD
ncbi:DUF302 domain-containing protein [Streptacidiphilus melanogenes]|uniref:DUF302 domain-containing protein n=1 Tax=Streptacidiphilus melanogenes TaxID=411235 RepID=UPI0005A9A65A|nr:DUF302 domain-containing protein [Streptacidiphilus melanogenes]